jgi:hypothetical protein
MNNNFNLKSFLAEGKLLKEETSSDLKKIFDLYVEGILKNTVSRWDDDEEENQVQEVIDTAQYNTVDELIDSIYNVEEEIANIMGHSVSDFTNKTAQNLSKICDNINFPNKLEFLHSFLKYNWDDLGWDEEDQKEEWDNFLNKI